MQTRKDAAQHDHHDGRDHCEEHCANGDGKSKDANAQPAEESCGGDNDADKREGGHGLDIEPTRFKRIENRGSSSVVGGLTGDGPTTLPSKCTSSSKGSCAPTGCR